jgi:hypothetical protein
MKEEKKYKRAPLIAFSYSTIPSIKPEFNFQLLLRVENSKLKASSNAFMTIWCTDAGSK